MAHLTRRALLTGAATVALATALPAVPALSRSPVLIGIDWGVLPSWSAAWMVRYNAEREIMEITGINALDLYRTDVPEQTVRANAETK